MRLLPHLPVLWRGGDAHQAGLARPVPLTASEARSLAAGEVPGPGHELRARLHAARLTVDDAPHPPGPRVRVRGLTMTGVAAAEALARAGARLSLVDPRRDDSRSGTAGALPPLGSGSRAARAARLVRDLRPGLPVDLDRDRAVEAEVVVAVGTLPTDVRHRLMVGSTPHVAALADEAGVTVMPVRPGLTACTRCRDLTLARTDAAWPVLALQCGGLEPAPDAPSASVAGALAAAAALAFAAGRTPAHGWRVERGLPRTLAWAADAGCGCR